jgi:peptidoglycan/xylan/chitin deacetylase (PgdA/CDA1 family)
MKRLVTLLVAILLFSWLSLPALTANADSTNLIANPSAETLSSGNPTNWAPDTWGTSTTTLAPTNDAHSGTEALSVITTSRSSGDAKWIPDAASVTAGQTYTYTDYSKATVPTQLVAAYVDANSTVTYAYLGSVAASTAWQLNTVDLTVPAGGVSVRVLHILPTAGTLITDDFSLTAQTPPVILPPPTSGNLIANPSMETANGPTPANWQTNNWGTNVSNFSYVINDGHTGTGSAKVQITSYTSGDAKWYFNPVNVQPSTQYTFSDFYKATIGSSLVARYDDGSGNYTYATLASPATASSWTQTSVTFTTPSNAKYVTVFHLIAGVGTLQTDDASLTLSSQSTSPTISITSPQNGATVSGSVVVTTTPNSANGISSVQLQLDGANLGSPVTSAPYQFTWNTATTINGSHTLTAILTPTSGSPVTSTVVQVTVNNTAPGSNLIPNASLETPNSSNSKLPLSWQSGKWGTNSTTFSYLTTSGHAGTHSIKAQITSYTNGAAYWHTTSGQPVTGGQLYSYKDYFKSNIPSEIDATYTMADGSQQDVYLDTAFASPNSWTKFEIQFTAPANAVSVIIYHDIYSVGYVQTDDYSLTQFSYQGFNRALVSITADDGFDNYYTNALPILQKYNLPSTAYVISGYIDATSDGYLSLAHLKALQAAGVEIGSHSVTHPNLSTLNATQQDNELKNSQATLQKDLGVPIADYAAPYGAYNQQIVTDAAKYYQTYRGVQSGYNAINNFDPLNLRVQDITSSTTLADVQGWLAEAAATNTWLILVYHQVNPSPSAGEYNTVPSDFDAQMDAVKNSGLAVETVAQAFKEVSSQLGK